MAKTIQAEVPEQVKPKEDDKKAPVAPKPPQPTTATAAQPSAPSGDYDIAARVMSRYISTLMPSASEPVKRAASYLYPYLTLLPGTEKIDDEYGRSKGKRLVFRSKFADITKDDAIKILSGVTGVAPDKIEKSKAFAVILGNWDPKSSIKLIPNIKEAYALLENMLIQAREITTETLILGVTPDYRTDLACALKDVEPLKGTVSELKGTVSETGTFKLYSSVGIPAAALIKSCKERNISNPLELSTELLGYLNKCRIAWCGEKFKPLEKNNLEGILSESSAQKEIIDVVAQKLSTPEVDKALKLFSGDNEKVTEALRKILISMGVKIKAEFEYETQSSPIYQIKMRKDYTFSEIPKEAAIQALITLCGPEYEDFIRKSDINTQWKQCSSMQSFREFYITAGYASVESEGITLADLVLASKDGKPLLCPGLDADPTQIIVALPKANKTNYHNFNNIRGDSDYKKANAEKFEQEQELIFYKKMLRDLSLDLAKITETALKYNLAVDANLIDDAKEVLQDVGIEYKPKAAKP